MLPVWFGVKYHATPEDANYKKIRHRALFAKDAIEGDQIFWMACVLPTSLAGGKREHGWQPVSPQVSPSNELWTSCFGRAGLKSPQKPAQQRPGSRWPWAAGLARSHLRYSRNSATLYCTICTDLTNLFTRGKYGKGQNWLLIWGKNHPFICKWNHQSVFPLRGISFKDI